MRVGADIGAICRKCGDGWHVVVAIARGRIAKVECKQCGARHAYRPADGPEAGGRRPVAKAVAAKSSKAKASRAGSRARARSPLVVEPDMSRPPRPYRPSERYEMGDRVSHPSFGQGVVQRTAGLTKVHVLFADGPKTLVHARGAG